MLNIVKVFELTFRALAIVGAEGLKCTLNPEVLGFRREEREERGERKEERREGGERRGGRREERREKGA